MMKSRYYRFTENKTQSVVDRDIQLRGTINGLESQIKELNRLSGEQESQLK